MKYLIFIFLIFISQSCSLNKKIFEKEIELVNLSNNESIDDKSIEEEDITEIVLQSPIRDKRVEVPNLSISQDKSSDVKYNIINKYNIKNYIDTTNIVNYDMGIIGYNIPSNFKVNEWSTIKLRISRKNKIESIVLGTGSRPISLVDINSKDDIILDRIKVDDFMKAKLYSDDNVEVRSVTTESQRLSNDGYTEWVWRVKPKTSDPCYIKMIITMSDVDYVVYEEEILVDPNWLWSFSNWFSKWWQAITATIITPILIPLIIWFRKRRKSNESD
jgi:hypothetical protein